MDEHRHVDHFLVERGAMAPVAMIVQLVSVVGSDQHHGIFQQSLPAQDGQPVDLAEAATGPLVLVFYRGFW